MNFSGISNSNLAGRLIRWPLRLLPSNARMPVLQGPLRGRSWIVGSGNHGCWLGSYEQDKCRLFEARLRPGWVVFDIGANVGYYTLLSAVLVGESGRVIAFEPLPANLEYLKKHVEMNRLRQVEVIGAAVAEHGGEAKFAVSASRLMGHLASDGDVTVRQVALDEMIASGEIPRPNCLKIDVEGAEEKVLRGARKLLESSQPDIFLATHGAEVHEACCRLLTDLGYELRSIDDQPLAETSEIFASVPKPHGTAG